MHLHPSTPVRSAAPLRAQPSPALGPTPPGARPPGGRGEPEAEPVQARDASSAIKAEALFPVPQPPGGRRVPGFPAARRRLLPVGPKVRKTWHAHFLDGNPEVFGSEGLRVVLLGSCLKVSEKTVRTTAEVPRMRRESHGTLEQDGGKQSTSIQDNR